MAPEAVALASDVECNTCGYDLRAHPHGLCPECGAPVAPSHALAAIPRAPAWGDSDPRWRRRMVAGVWCLAVLLVVHALDAFNWRTAVPVPRISDFHGTLASLDDTLFAMIYTPILFCVGIVLLFSKERDRRRRRLDWTRRWGVILSYCIFIIAIAGFASLCALVVLGIAALCLSIAAAFQPASTDVWIKIGTYYTWYGPQPSRVAGVLVPVFSALAILLACVPLYRALRSSGPRVSAMLLTAALALPAAWQVAAVAVEGMQLFIARGSSFFGNRVFAHYFYAYYFSPDFTFRPPTLFGAPDGNPNPFRVGLEFIKWFGFAVVTAWLTLAQIGAWRRRIKKELKHPTIP